MRRVGAYLIQVKLPCPLGLLSQWGLFVAKDMAIAKLLVDQEELQLLSFLLTRRSWQLLSFLLTKTSWQLLSFLLTRRSGKCMGHR
jgi:hypothetical protein